ncbi:MAG: hypothetical protein NTW38_01545 [Candidatus Aminicenantes bacterium]|nr:hypothetical protein [Candidatus Aminicenantes bacterium]
MKKSLIGLMLVVMVAGFNGSFSQNTNDIVRIVLKNQFVEPVDFYINGKFVCSAAGYTSCVSQVNIRNAPLKLEAWGDNNTKLKRSKTIDALEPGKDIVWETGNATPRNCMIAMYNPNPFPVRFFINGEDQGYCQGTMPGGSPGSPSFNILPVVLGSLGAAYGIYELSKLLTGQGWDGTYDASVYTWSPIGDVTRSGTFSVSGGNVSDSGGTFTGTVASDGTFTGTTIICQGCVSMRVCGTFSKVDTFHLTTNGLGCSNGSNTSGQTITAKKR